MILDWMNFASVLAEVWKEFSLDWIMNANDALVSHYENMMYHKHEELRKIMRYLNLPIDEKRIECTVKHSEGVFKRKPQEDFNKL